MIWLVLLFVVVVAVVMIFSLPESSPEKVSYDVQLDLYAIRRRLDVLEFKQEIRREAQRLQRELDRELRG